MTVTQLKTGKLTNLPFYEERVDLAAAFRWTARLNMHEAVANHFSLAINDDGTRFLMNPNQVHFSRIKASDLLLIDANDPETLTGPDAPQFLHNISTNDIAGLPLGGGCETYFCDPRAKALSVAWVYHVRLADGLADLP